MDKSLVVIVHSHTDSNNCGTKFFTTRNAIANVGGIFYITHFLFDSLEKPLKSRIFS